MQQNKYLLDVKLVQTREKKRDQKVVRIIPLKFDHFCMSRFEWV